MFHTRFMSAATCLKSFLRLLPLVSQKADSDKGTTDRYALSWYTVVRTASRRHGKVRARVGEFRNGCRNQSPQGYGKVFESGTGR